MSCTRQCKPCCSSGNNVDDDDDGGGGDDGDGDDDDDDADGCVGGDGSGCDGVITECPVPVNASPVVALVPTQRT